MGAKDLGSGELYGVGLQYKLNPLFRDCPDRTALHVEMNVKVMYVVCNKLVYQMGSIT